MSEEPEDEHSETDSLLLKKSDLNQSKRPKLKMMTEHRAAGSREVMRTPSDPGDDSFMDEIRTSANTDLSHLADRSQGSIHAANGGGQLTTVANVPSDILNDEPVVITTSNYEDFHTIDWQRDLARDRLRHKFILRRMGESCFGWASGVWDASSGWICVLLVGLTAGAVAGVIDIGTRWMTDLKDGICADRFWLDREHCCWSANDSAYKEDDCNAWTSWPEMLAISDRNVFYYLVGFIFYCCWAVGMAGLTVTLVKVFAPYACGSGIPEIKCILSGFIIRGYLGKWTFLIKSVGLILATASGLSLGKEGPMVHLACCIGNIFSYLFPKYGKNEAKKREILSASAAAGVSVAFGAPIGGVMFSLEEASYYFPLKTMWRSFFCALIAGIILRLVNPFGSDQTSLFHVDYSMKWTFLELIPFGMLGIFGGIIGSLFIWANIKWCRYRKSSKRLGAHPIAEVLIVAALTAAMSYPNPYARKSASSLIKQLFDRCGPEDAASNLCDYLNKTFSSAKIDDNYHTGALGLGIQNSLWQLVIALILKLIFTIFTFGIKVPAGLFVPSMAMGAIAGRLLGVAMEQLTVELQRAGSTSRWQFSYCQIGKDCVMPGLYAMVGAAAVLGGVTRMTVSLVVIMFELTGSLEFIVPTMVAVMFAKWVGDAIVKTGIYDAHIELNGYPFLDNKEEYQYSTVASNVMRPGPGEAGLRVITQDSMNVGDIEQLLRDTDYNGFPVVVNEEKHYLVGFLTRRDLKLAINNARKTQDGIVTNSLVYFTSSSHHSSGAPFSAESQTGTIASGAAPLRLRKLMDLAPITVTDQTPMETVIDMFRKLGLRQVLVTRNGRLLGIITKKDALMHMKERDGKWI